MGDYYLLRMPISIQAISLVKAYIDIYAAMHGLLFDLHRWHRFFYMSFNPGIDNFNPEIPGLGNDPGIANPIQDSSLTMVMS